MLKSYKTISILAIIIFAAAAVAQPEVGPALRQQAALERLRQTGHGYTAGVDIGGTQMSVSILNSEGEVIATEGDTTDIPDEIKDKDVGGIKTIQKLDTQKKVECKDNLLVKIAGLIVKTAEKAGITAQDIDLVGVGSPGNIRHDGFVELAYNVPFQEIYLPEEIAEVWNKTTGRHIRVYVKNDMVTASAGESNQTYTRNFPRFTYVTLSTGMNAARFDRNTMQGTDLELASRKVTVDDKTVILEALTSGRAIANIAKEKIKKGRATMILNRAGNDLERITSKEVGDAARLDSDQLALEILESVGTHLGWGIVESVKEYVRAGTALEEELFVIGGGVTNIGPILKTAIENGISKAASEVKDVRLPGIKIEFSVVGPKRGTIGAALLARALDEKTKQQLESWADRDKDKAWRQFFDKALSGEHYDDPNHPRFSNAHKFVEAVGLLPAEEEIGAVKVPSASAIKMAEVYI